MLTAEIPADEQPGTTTAAAPLAPEAAIVRDDYLAQLALLANQVRRVDRDLVARWSRDTRVERLMNIPGIGPLTTIVLVLELGDIGRFSSAKHVASYIGLTPRVRASTDRVRTGHISKEGNRILRWLLVVAAMHAARRWGPLRTWYRTLQQRKGRKVARIALARRLVEIVYHVWKEEGSYFWNCATR
jgi:transposase